MKYHDPAGWQRPCRAAQHAAPFRLSSSVRRQAHAALRLFVTAGTGAAGLCLIIGLVVLLTHAAAPGARARQLAAAGRPTAPATRSQRAQVHRAGDADSRAASQALSPSLAATGKNGRAPDRVIAEFAGRGNQVTRQFSVKTGARLELRWSYICPAGLPLDQLIVEDAGGTPRGHASLGESIDATATGGSGATWVVPSGDSHYLVVISTCSWHMKVVQSR
jgi:hypothetical protein